LAEPPDHSDRHAYGDIYRAAEQRAPGGAVAARKNQPWVA